MSYNPRAAGALCDQCPLNGKKFVPPTGPMDPELLVCGEAPGVQEEKRRTPFVGASGILFDEQCRKAGIDRRRIWITNAVLCRPDTPGVSGAKRYDMTTYLKWIGQQNKARKKHAKETKIVYVPMQTPLACCRPRLMRELEWFSSVCRRRGDAHAAIGAMGNYASRALTGKNIGIMKLRGSTFPLYVDQPGGAK